MVTLAMLLGIVFLSTLLRVSLEAMYGSWIVVGVFAGICALFYAYYRGLKKGVQVGKDAELQSEKKEERI